MHKSRWTLLLALVMLLSLAACSGAPKVDWELSISGDVDNPLTLSYSDLAGMEQVALDEIMMEKSTGEDEVTSWSGGSLTAFWPSGRPRPGPRCGSRPRRRGC